MKDKVLNWMVHGQVGISSKAMACAAVGLEPDKTWFSNHPCDPDDFNRCLLLLKEVPEIREHLDKIAALSDVWTSLIQRWDEIEKLFLDEVGFNWAKGGPATKTYALMKDIGC